VFTGGLPGLFCGEKIRLPSAVNKRVGGGGGGWRRTTCGRAAVAAVYSGKGQYLYIVAAARSRRGAQRTTAGRVAWRAGGGEGTRDI